MPSADALRGDDSLSPRPVACCDTPTHTNTCSATLASAQAESAEAARRLEEEVSAAAAAGARPSLRAALLALGAVREAEGEHDAALRSYVRAREASFTPDDQAEVYIRSVGLGVGNATCGAEHAS